MYIGNIYILSECNQSIMKQFWQTNSVKWPQFKACLQGTVNFNRAFMF